MKAFDRYFAVMHLLDQTTLKQVANFAAGKFVMVLEETRDGIECWWCPADAEDHTGEVIHTSEKLFKGQDMPEEMRQFFDVLGIDITFQDILKNCDRVELGRPGAANLTLKLILEEETQRLQREAMRPHVDGLTTSILA